jgi:hypothetical protein
MNTILVCYTKKKLTKAEAHKYKRYAFNTRDKVLVGDLIESPNYDTPMRVVKVLPKSYEYYNASNGELSNAFSSTSQWEIRELVIREETEDIVYGSISERSDEIAYA